MRKPNITRRGFRNAPRDVREQAEGIVQEWAEENAHILAELRPASYCGPGSGGDRGAYTLNLNGSAYGFSLLSIERTQVSS